MLVLSQTRLDSQLGLLVGVAGDGADGPSGRHLQQMDRDVRQEVIGHDAGLDGVLPDGLEAVVHPQVVDQEGARGVVVLDNERVESVRGGVQERVQAGAIDLHQGIASREGGSPLPPQDPSPHSALKAFPYPNTSSNRIPNRK